MPPSNNERVPRGTLDALDRALVHALQIDGRASSTRIAAVLGVSVQTVTRRYHRLRTGAGLRVVGLPDLHRSDTAHWLVRLSTATRSTGDIAAALARRTDTSWIKILSGGTGIVAVVEDPPDTPGAGQALLLHDIPRTAAITGIDAQYLLHFYRGGPTAWPGHLGALGADQITALTPPTPSGPPAAVGPDDAELLRALGRDGRTSLVDLAAATGRTPATIARRIDQLRSGGAIFFDVDLPARMLGAATVAMVWLTVAPGRLDAVATALACDDEPAFVAATTGTSNLVVQIQVADATALHHYLTHRLGALDGIQTLESAPVLRTVKAAAQPDTTPSVRRALW